ncbi:response regulator [Rhodopila sp.]|uniref:response regulator n=1 Tax=Rhodopila sp. TaxID=2480087 RepID=UPI003D0B3DD5
MTTPPIVIIAEPDPMISSALRVEFTHLDFAVFLAASGREAEDYAAHAVAHLIVLDTKLHLQAYDACVRIRRRSGYAGRPIVMTANDPTARMKAAADKAGANLVLAKPYSVRDLLNAVTPFVPDNDLLLSHRARGPGMAQAQEWVPTSNLTWQSGINSALTRNGRLLPIVRGGNTVSIPLYRKLVT